MECPDCPFVAKSNAGLAAHRRWAHPSTQVKSPNERVVGPNEAAIEVTLGELSRAGRLEPVDTAKVQALRSMARSLDLNPFNSQMWREYREAIEGLTRDDRDSRSIDALIDELSSPVRDST